jgi:hypothetical protein
MFKSTLALPAVLAGSPLPVGDLSVRMRNDRHEPNGAKTQRPERIPIDPERRRYSRNATAAVAIDSLLQTGGRLEHDDATRRSRHPDGGLRIAADTLTFPDFACHSSVSLQSWNPDHREMRISAQECEPGTRIRL